MKNLINLVIAGALSISLSYAQDQGQRQNRTPEEMTKMQIERLSESLALNKNQQDSIYKYTLIANLEQRKLMESAGDNREAGFEKIRSMRENNNKIIKTFLTSDQAKKYEELTKNRRQGQGRRSN